MRAPEQVELAEFQALSEGIPPISDRVLVDVVNGMHVNRELLAHGRRRGFFGRLVAGLLDGGKQGRLFDANQLRISEGTLQLVLELQERLRASELALRLTQSSLREVRQAVRTHVEALETHEWWLEQLEARLTHAVGRLDAHEQRLENLELRVLLLEAYQDADRSLAAWASGRTYGGLPWLVQLPLLAQEVFSGKAGLGRLPTRDAAQLVTTFVDVVERELRDRDVPEQFSLAAAVDGAWAQMDANQRSLAADILDVRDAPPELRADSPYGFVLGAAFELAQLPEGVALASPGAVAREIASQRLERVPRVAARRELVESLAVAWQRRARAVMQGGDA
jgi:predicted transcriptional regulator